MPQWSAVIGRDGTANRRFVKGRFNRQPLTVTRQNVVDLVEPRACLHGGREISVLVCDDGVESPRTQKDINGGRDAAPADFRSASANDDRGPLLRRRYEHRRNIIGGRRLNHLARHDTVDARRTRRSASPLAYQLHVRTARRALPFRMDARDTGPALLRST